MPRISDVRFESADNSTIVVLLEDEPEKSSSYAPADAYASALLKRYLLAKEKILNGTGIKQDSTSEGCLTRHHEGAYTIHEYFSNRIPKDFALDIRNPKNGNYMHTSFAIEGGRYFNRNFFLDVRAFDEVFFP